MKVAVLSDIHSNYHAFLACYEDAVSAGAESFVFLGDYISDLAEPRKTMDLVYEIQLKYPAVCLRGNRERYMLDQESGTGDFRRGSKSGSLLFTYEHLRKQDLAFFEALKISDTVVLAGVPMEIAHAGMEDDRHYFEGGDDRIASVFAEMKSSYLLTGHSHRQYIQQSGSKTIINPGSVGIPQSGDQKAQYAMLDIVNGNVSCELRKVSYDLAAVIHTQFASGLAGCAKYWAIGVLYDLIKGKECVLELLHTVLETGDVYDEAVWHTAAEKMGMKFTEQEILEAFQNSLR